MTAPHDRITLSYRTPARLAWPAWLTRDKLAETLIGLGWTACGIGAILTVICWLFLRMEPRSPITGPWWALIVFCLGFSTLGLAMALAAVPMRFWPDSILTTLWVMTLLLAMVAYAAVGYVIATAPAPPTPTAPLQFQGPAEDGG